MRLENTIKHISSSGFWRLFALVAKRLLSVAKLVSKLPFIFTPILYGLHFLRAILRVGNYFLNTQNKNLGETRKFLFSAFKVAIAIAAFILCFFMPIPAVLATAFLLYSVIKLIDSAAVLIFSFLAHFKINNSPENKWRRDQYWDNIIKHTSILAIGVAMTLLTAIALAGGVAAVVWTSPVMVLSLTIASVVTGAAIVYSAGLFYQRFKVRNGNTELKKEYDAKIKKFAKVFTCWLLCLASVIVPFLCPPAAALWLVPVLLGFYNLFDAGKSSYDYLDNTKVTDSEPAGLEPKNSLENAVVSDYYGNKDRVIYLKMPKNEDTQKELYEKLRSNEIFVVKEALVKLAELQTKIERLENKEGVLPFFSEKSKIVMKKNYLIRELAQTLKRDWKDNIDLIHLIMHAISDLEKDREELLKTNKPLNLKTEKNIQNIQCLVEYSMELLQYIPCQYERNKKNHERNKNNFLLDLLEAYESKTLNENKDKPKACFQSFWKKRSEFEALSLFFKANEEVEKEAIARRSNLMRGHS
ncbi:MAG: hypothetical protein V4471_06415 [Pseudomonadota bacterium]